MIKKESCLLVDSTAIEPAQPQLPGSASGRRRTLPRRSWRSYLIPPPNWPALRPEVCTQTQTPQDGATRVKERQTELEALLRRFDDELPRYPSLRIEDESLVVGSLYAEDKPPSLVAREALIDARLALVELPDLLMEVDGQWRTCPTVNSAGAPPSICARKRSNPPSPVHRQNAPIKSSLVPALISPEFRISRASSMIKTLERSRHQTACHSANRLKETITTSP